jgi:hypothetical protein
VTAQSPRVMGQKPSGQVEDYSISGKVSGNVIFGDNVRYIGENKGTVKDAE